jgi:RNA polymerase sigma-70 factor (ECF subfamily)
MTVDTTPLTLLETLRRPDAPAADWDRFARIYTPLLLDWARRRGFQDADARDVAQDVLVRLLRLLPEYHRGDGQSFRNWLRRVAENLARDFRRRRATRPLPDAAGLDDVGAEGLLGDPDDYRREVVHRALTVIRADFAPTTWEAFARTAVAGRTAAEVAAELGLSKAAVHLARNRVLRRLRETVAGLTELPGTIFPDW